MTAAVFLPGILMPATLRYAPLIAELDGDETLLTKELEIYEGTMRPADYSMASEVAGLARFADRHGLERFHLYGHSAGGAIALAFVAAHPDRVASLALDEPATDFSDEDRDVLERSEVADLGSLPEDQRMATFVRTLVRPGVEVGPPPPIPAAAAAEMAKRPSGVLTFVKVIRQARVDLDALRSFPGPVYYSYGSLSHERWETMATRMPTLFASCTVERYEGLHHMHTSHAAEPARVATALRALWSQAR